MIDRDSFKREFDLETFNKIVDYFKNKKLKYNCIYHGHSIGLSDNANAVYEMGFGI